MHIYEPRYRLMLRRCLESQRVFGLSNVRQGSDGSWKPCSVGTLLHISSCNTLPDGRSYIETVGMRRYRILEIWEQDGYMMGKVEWIGRSLFVLVRSSCLLFPSSIIRGSLLIVPTNRR
jgi:Lon protease-like protein